MIEPKEMSEERLAEARAGFTVSLSLRPGSAAGRQLDTIIKLYCEMLAHITHQDQQQDLMRRETRRLKQQLAASLPGDLARALVSEAQWALTELRKADAAPMVIAELQAALAAAHAQFKEQQEEKHDA